MKKIEGLRKAFEKDKDMQKEKGNENEEERVKTSTEPGEARPQEIQAATTSGTGVKILTIQTTREDREIIKKIMEIECSLLTTEETARTTAEMMRFKKTGELRTTRAAKNHRSANTT